MTAGSSGERIVLPTIAVVSAAAVIGLGLMMLGEPAGVEAGSVVMRLPSLNAFLNGLSALLATAGYFAIRGRRIAVHKACMLSAFVGSVLFLASYVVYHAHVGSHPFRGHGPIRLVYLVLLASHVVLAAVILPLALLTIWRGLSAQYVRHRRVARWTLPLWLYVSVTGVLVYWMLYHLGP